MEHMHSEIPAIEIHNVWKRYQQNQVLKGLDLTVPIGKTVIILGRSGVGKSVLLRQILGIEKPDQGTVNVMGKCINSMTTDEIYQFRHSIGMLFQSSALFDSMTVGENVAFYLNQHGDPATGKSISQQEIKDRVYGSLKKVGLEEHYKKMPSDLSGGQKRRAALARLIIYKPKIVLYDEPTTGLDPVTSMHINDLIKNTQIELQASSIVVTHDILSALEIGDYFAFHHEGKIHTFEKKEDFIQSNDPLIRDFLSNAIVKENYSKLISR